MFLAVGLVAKTNQALCRHVKFCTEIYSVRCIMSLSAAAVSCRESASTSIFCRAQGHDKRDILFHNTLYIKDNLQFKNYKYGEEAKFEIMKVYLLRATRCKLHG
jgi:hypothetical protein